MYNTPKDASDSQINSLFEIALAISAEHAENLKADPGLAARLDAGGMEAIKTYAETLGPCARSTPIIDLQRRYKIEVEREPTLDRLRSYVARDLNSFDPDPEMKLHIEGRGESPQAAVLDLLDQLAEIFEPTERDRMLERAENQVRRDASMIQAYSDRQSLIAQLDEWDSDWREHYGTIESAECNYLRDKERQP